LGVINYNNASSGQVTMI